MLSKAAGLFVDPAKGPVLLNYGIDECRFTKPVYAGATIGVRFTVKEKIDQKKKDEEDIAYLILNTVERDLVKVGPSKLLQFLYLIS